MSNFMIYKIELKRVIFSVFYYFWNQHYCWTVASIIGRSKPDWDTRGGEEFTDRGPNFLNCVQHIFPGRGKIFSGETKPSTPLLVTGLIIFGNDFLFFISFHCPQLFSAPPALSTFRRPCPCLCYLCLQSNICFVLRCITIFVLFEYPFSSLSVSVSLNVRFTTNGVCSKTYNHIYVARTNEDLM